jgi:hypothetical protein
MKQMFLLFASWLLPLAVFAQNQRPQIQNLQTSIDWGAQSLVLQYDVNDAENDSLEVMVYFSNNQGKDYALSADIILNGDWGYPVMPGTGKTITCNLSAINPFSGPFTLRLVADDKQVFDIQSLVNEVDSNRLRAQLEFVEGIRHRTTGAGHLVAVRDSMKQLLNAAGLYVEEHTFSYTGGYTGRNVLGSQQGTLDGNKVVVVDAHYDSVTNAPGADDNGSGTVGVWEIGQILGQYPSKKTLRCIGFDLEEAGLIGSTRYVQTGIPATEQIEGVLNFEMIGYYSEEPNSQTLPAGFNVLFPAAYNEVVSNQWKGNFITNVGNANAASLAAAFKNAANQFVPELRVITLEVPGNGQIAPDLRRSDHAPFWDAGNKALMLTDGANFRNECYHTPGDTLNEKLDFTFMSNVVKATLATIAQLIEIQHADQVYRQFDGLVNVVDPVTCNLLAYTVPGQSERLYLEMSDCNESLRFVEIFDVQGKRIYQSTAFSNSGSVLEIELPNVTSGIYFLKCHFLKESRALKFVVD